MTGRHPCRRTALWLKPEQYHDSFCQDLDAEEGAVLGVMQKAPLASTFGDTVSDPAWKHKPSWYQVSTADRMISPVNQERMAARLQARQVITLSQPRLAGIPARRSGGADTGSGWRGGWRVSLLATASPLASGAGAASSSRR